MDYRTGKCSQCGAVYKVPASFAHNQARCKVCKGVVRLSAPHEGAQGAPASAAGPAEGTESPGVPARKVVPKPAAPRAARPAVPEARKGFPAAPSARPPVPARPPDPLERPAEPRGGTLERLKSERRGQPASPAAALGHREAHGAHGTHGTHEHGASHARHAHHAHEKKPPMVGILCGVGLVVVGGLLVLFRHQIFGGGGEPEPLAPDAAALPAGAAPAAPGGAPLAASTTTPEPSREPAAGAPAPEKPADKPAKKSPDPNSIDLAAIADFGPTPDTSSEEWAQMNEWMAQWMDIEAGAAGNRAKLRLMERKRKAVPAILNFFKRQDFATKEGRSNGDQCQKALMQICNGTNFDWKYADEAAGRPFDHPDDVWFCKRVVELWSNSWKQAEQSIEAWIKIAKLDDKDPAEAKRLREMFGGQASGEESAAPKGDDDLEVD